MINLINLIHLNGRVGADPEVKWLESGKCLVILSLAVRGKKKDSTDWFNLELWEKTAEIASDYVKKGSLIGVKGSLKINYWTDRNTGIQRFKPVIVVRELDLLSSPRQEEYSEYGNY